MLSIDLRLINQVDELVRERKFADRSQFIGKAVEEKLLRLRRTYLAGELTKIDRKVERQLANERLASESAIWRSEGAL
jgi:Arc/MetJ-type ribon-helix-helix transcriptional regulator